MSLRTGRTMKNNVDEFLTHHGLEKVALRHRVKDYLVHYGVIGMKWGVRKDRSGRRRTTKQVEAENKRSSNKSSNSKNTFSNNPKNKRLNDAELSKIIRRLEMEQRLSTLTKPQAAPPNRLKGMIKDVAFDVTKGALTEVGKAALSQALKIQYNKRAGAEYQISVKQVSDAIKKAKG